MLITVLMLAVGAGLFAWYQKFAPSAELAAKFRDNSNFVFPTWIVNEVPTGVSGLVLAGAFAAAISSLDSILAALSQTSLSIIYGRERMEREGEEMVKRSRIAVCIWGGVLTLAGLGLWWIYTNNKDSDLIGLAFGMVAYTYGPLLGVLMAALLPWKTSTNGLFLGTLFSIALVAWFRPELMIVLQSLGMEQAVVSLTTSRPKLASEWFFPLNAALTYFAGLIGAKMKP